MRVGSGRECLSPVPWRYRACPSGHSMATSHGTILRTKGGNMDDRIAKLKDSNGAAFLQKKHGYLAT